MPLTSPLRKRYPFYQIIFKNAPIDVLYPSSENKRPRPLWKPAIVPSKRSFPLFSLHHYPTYPFPLPLTTLLNCLFLHNLQGLLHLHLAERDMHRSQLRVLQINQLHPSRMQQLAPWIPFERRQLQ